MALTPFRPGSLTRTNANLLVTMRRDMKSLQRQLQTGQRADTYGGLGFERRTSLDMRARLSAIEGFTATIDQTELRLKMMTQNLERLNKLGQDTKSDMMLSKFELLSDGTTFAQKNAEQRLKEVVDLLNADIAGRSLFAGRAVDKLPMESFDKIMNGDGARVGLKEMIRQRTLAELGGVPGTGMGRLTSAVAGNVVTLSTENPVPPFGFRIAGASATGAGIAAANAAGPPQTATFTVNAQPAAGDTVTVNLTDADGNNFSVTLTASTLPGQAGALTSTFQIGANAAATAANLNAALAQAVKEKAAMELQPRAAMKTAEAFFAATPANLANLRVDGPPYENSAGMVAGTAANTLIWYNGDDDPAVADRNTAPVRIDQGQVVATGARANEPAIRNVMAQLGVLAASTFQNTKVDAERYRVMTEKVFDKLSDKPGNPKVADIASELAQAVATMKGTKERHASTEGMIYDALDGVEGVNKEEIAMGIMELQNRLQASYQTTAMLSQLSLVNYL